MRAGRHIGHLRCRIKLFRLSSVMRNSVTSGDIVASTPQKVPVTCAHTVPAASMRSTAVTCHIRVVAILRVVAI